jgi:hypothetical protein
VGGVYFYLHVGSCISHRSQLLVWKEAIKECWNYTRDLDRTMNVAHYTANYMLHWPTRCRRPSNRHELMSTLLDDHGIGLTGCEHSVYTNQKVYDIS